MSYSIKTHKPYFVVDYREPELYVDLLKEKGSFVKVERLEVGDVFIKPSCFVEIKRGKDVLSSVFDGRLFRQLDGVKGKKVVVIENFKGEKDSVFYGSIARLIASDIYVVETSDEYETVEFLYRLYFKLREKPSVVINKPKKNVDSSLSILLSIPTIGEKKAKKLLDVFGSVKGVANASFSQLKLVVGERSATYVWEAFNKKFGKMV